MSKKLVFATLAIIVAFAIGLPYGAFSWNTSAQSYEEVVVPPPAANVVEYAGGSYPSFIEDGKLAIYGECLGINCSQIALIDFSTIESGTTVYEGLVTIVVYELEEGLWQLNFYENGFLIDDKTRIIVDANGAVLSIERD